MRPITMQALRPKNAESQRGASLSGIAIIVALVAMFAVPLMRLAAETIRVRQLQEAATSDTVLETARDALISYAAANNGCLPFAADFEGGLADTDQTGATSPTYVDSGVGTANKHAGDLPWADLGLSSGSFASGQLRVQYYVASDYADPTGDCDARFRGFEWDASVSYFGSDTSPVYVYYTIVGDSDGIALAQEPNGAGNLTLNGVLVTAGTAVFASPRRVSVSTDGDEKDRTFTIFGTDKDGLTIQEVVTGPNKSVVVTTASFLTVTQVTIDGAADKNVRVGISSDRRLYKITEFLPASMEPSSPGDPFETTLTVAAQPNNTSITVVSSSDFSVGDFIGITLNGGKRHVTTIVGIPSGTTIDLTDAISGAAASVGNKVSLPDPDDVTDALPDRMLEVRLGPDVTAGPGNETNTAGAQNVVVLIAPGKNRNAELNRGYVRDSNHVDGSTGLSWPLDVANVDSMIFSYTPNTDPVDSGSDGDDRLLALSFSVFKEKVSLYGINVEPVCASTVANPDPC